MRRIEIPITTNRIKIPLGRVSENLVTQVIFDCGAWVETYGQGDAELIHKRSGDSIGYKCLQATQEDEILTWTVTNDDTGYQGLGQLQVRWYVDDALKQSAVYTTETLPSLTASEDEPAEVRSALDLLLQMVENIDVEGAVEEYMDEHPIEAPVTSVNEQIGDVVITAQSLGALTEHQDISGKADKADLSAVATSGNYNDLSNKPTIPTKTSDLTNDSGFLTQHQSLAGYATETWVGQQGFLTSYTETDPTVPAWAKASSKPSYTASEVGALPSTTVIPSKTSDLTNDSGFVTQEDVKEQILSDDYTEEKVPYLYREAPYSVASVEEKIVGGTVGWNQLCNDASVTVTSGHKYYMVKGGVKSIGASTGTAITGLTGGTDIVTDLTTMLGSTIADYIYSLETATAGAGVSKLKEWGFFNEDYYEYCEPTLKSVEGLQSKVTRDADENIIATYPLDSSLTLRGIPKLDSSNNLYYDGDDYESDGTVSRRYGIVNLGTLNYSRVSGSDGTFIFTSGGLVGKKKGITNIISDCFLTTPITSWTNSKPNNSICGSATTTTVVIRADSYENVNDLKTSLNGHYAVCELATPTTETATPYHNPQLVGDTEEWVTTGIVPVGHETKCYAGTMNLINSKADKATTYTKTEVDTALSAKAGTSVATTSADGLMSSTDKGRLDDLYADYSSALTALGVI